MVDNFKCRICGSESYSTVTEDNGVDGPGYYSSVVGYECKGCSVRFGTLELWSVGESEDG